MSDPELLEHPPTHTVVEALETYCSERDTFQAADITRTSRPRIVAALTSAELKLRNHQLAFLQYLGPLPRVAGNEAGNHLKEMKPMSTLTRTFEIKVAGPHLSNKNGYGRKSSIALTSRKFVVADELSVKIEDMYVGFLPLTLLIKLLVHCEEFNDNWLMGFDITDSKGAKVYVPHRHISAKQTTARDDSKHVTASTILVMASELANMSSSRATPEQVQLQSPLIIAPRTADIQTQETYAKLHKLLPVAKWHSEEVQQTSCALGSSSASADREWQLKRSFFGRPINPSNPNPVHMLFPDIILEILSFADVTTLVALGGTTHKLAALLHYGVLDLSSGGSPRLADSVNGLTDPTVPCKHSDPNVRLNENKKSTSPKTSRTSSPTKRNSDIFWDNSSQPFDFYLRRWAERGSSAVVNIVRRINTTAEYIDETTEALWLAQQQHTTQADDNKADNDASDSHNSAQAQKMDGPLRFPLLTSACWVVHPSHFFVSAASMENEIEPSEPPRDSDEPSHPQEELTRNHYTHYGQVTPPANIGDEVVMTSGGGIRCGQVKIKGAQCIVNPWKALVDNCDNFDGNVEAKSVRPKTHIPAPEVAALCRSYEYHQKCFAEVLQPWYAAALHQQNIAALNDMVSATKHNERNNSHSGSEFVDDSGIAYAQPFPIPSEILALPQQQFNEVMGIVSTGASAALDKSTTRRYFGVDKEPQNFSDGKAVFPHDSTLAPIMVQVPVPLSGFRPVPWPIKSVDDLRVGMKIDALDTVRKWYASTIVEIDRGGIGNNNGSSAITAAASSVVASPVGTTGGTPPPQPRIKVHYDVWGNRWDEWLLLFVDPNAVTIPQPWGANPPLPPAITTNASSQPLVINPRLAALYSQSMKPSSTNQHFGGQAILNQLHTAPFTTNSALLQPSQQQPSPATAADLASHHTQVDGTVAAEDAKQAAFPAFNFIRSELRPFIFGGTATAFPFATLASTLFNTRPTDSYYYSATQPHISHDSNEVGEATFKEIALSLFPHLLSKTLTCKIAVISEGISGIDHALESQFIKKERLAEWIESTGNPGGPRGGGGQQDISGDGSGVAAAASAPLSLSPAATARSLSISATFSSSQLDRSTFPRMVMSGGIGPSGGALGPDEWIENGDNKSAMSQAQLGNLSHQQRIPITAPIAEAKVFMIFKIVPPPLTSIPPTTQSAALGESSVATNSCSTSVSAPYDVVGFAIIRYGRDQPSYGGI